MLLIDAFRALYQLLYLSIMHRLNLLVAYLLAACFLPLKWLVPVYCLLVACLSPTLPAHCLLVHVDCPLIVETRPLYTIH